MTEIPHANYSTASLWFLTGNGKIREELEVPSQRMMNAVEEGTADHIDLDDMPIVTYRVTGVPKETTISSFGCSGILQVALGVGGF